MLLQLVQDGADLGSVGGQGNVVVGYGTFLLIFKHFLLITIALSFAHQAYNQTLLPSYIQQQKMRHLEYLEQATLSMDMVCYYQYIIY